MKNTLADRFQQFDTARFEQMEKARRCAALTCPSVLKPLGHAAGSALPEPFQAIGQYGINNMLGRLLISMFDPTVRWATKELDPELRYTLEMAGKLDQIAQAETICRLQELMIFSYIDGIGSRGNSNRRLTGFLTQKRRSLMQELVTGSTLERLDDRVSDDGELYFTLRVFPRDCYVTRRDAEGSVVEHVTTEKVDILALDEKVRERARLPKSDYENKPSSERMVDLLTGVSWHPQSRTWVIKQEINGYKVMPKPREEKVTPFFPGEFDLVLNEHEGRGFVESLYPELASYDQLRERILDWAAMASKMVPIIDYNAEMREEDWEKKSGEPVRCRVQGGQAQDAGMLTVNGVANFQIVREVHGELRKELGQQFLLESETGPGGEAMRSPRAWEYVGQQLKGGLGGLYATMVDDHQLPLIERVEHVLQKRGKFDGLKLPNGAAHTRTLTGFAALASQAQIGKMTGMMQYFAPLGENALKSFDMRAMAKAWMRIDRVDVPGFIKTDEIMAREAEAANAQQAQLMAAQQAVKSAGNMAETAVAASVQPKAAA